MPGKRLTFTDNDGSWRVCTPNWEEGVRRGMTEAEFADFVWAKRKAFYRLPDDAVFHLVDTDIKKLKAACCGCNVFMHGYGEKTLSSQGAFEMGSDGYPVVNLSKARGIWMDRIRHTRNEELEMESGSKFRLPSEVEATLSVEKRTKLQELRDIPQTFDLTTGTVDELAKLWPAGLRASTDVWSKNRRFQEHLSRE